MGAEALQTDELADSGVRIAYRATETGYLYADSETFPYNFDFIAALVGFVDLAASVLSAARRARDLEGELGEARSLLEQQLTALEALLHNVRQAAEDKQAQSSHEFLVETVQRFQRSIEDMTSGTRKKLESELEAERVRVERATAQAHTEMVRAVCAFFLSCELEVRTYELTLQLMANGYEAEVTEQVAGGLGVTYAVDAARTSWDEPRKVADFVNHLTLPVGPKRQWLTGSVAVESRLLDDYVIGSLRVSATSMDIGLRRKREAKNTLTLHLDQREQGVDAQVVRAEHPTLVFDVPADDTAKLEQLWAALLSTTRIGLAPRASVKALSMDGEDALHAEAAPLIIDRLVQVYKPIVAEVARRSRSPRELALKRTVANGRREEHFLEKAALLEKVAELAPEDVARLAPLGLSAPHGPRVVRAEPSSGSAPTPRVRA